MLQREMYHRRGKIYKSRKHLCHFTRREPREIFRDATHVASQSPSIKRKEKCETYSARAVNCLKCCKSRGFILFRERFAAAFTFGGFE